MYKSSNTLPWHFMESSMSLSSVIFNILIYANEIKSLFFPLPLCMYRVQVEKCLPCMNRAKWTNLKHTYHNKNVTFELCSN